MTRSKHILALLVTLVALFALAPTASAAYADVKKVDQPNPRCGFC